MICGPDAMITAVADTLLDLGLPMRNVVYQRFDYGSGRASRVDRRRSRRFVAIGIALAASAIAFALR